MRELLTQISISSFQSSGNTKSVFPPIPAWELGEKQGQQMEQGSPAMPHDALLAERGKKGTCLGFKNEEGFQQDSSRDRGVTTSG